MLKSCVMPYAIEYDYVDPQELNRTLAVKKFRDYIWQGR